MDYIQAELMFGERPAAAGHPRVLVELLPPQRRSRCSKDVQK